MRRGDNGWVLAMAAPDPDSQERRVTVYWRGPEYPNMWAPNQREAARFVDEALARHLLAAAGQPTPRPGQPALTIWAEPALSPRNHGPATPIIDRAPDQPAPAGAPQSTQGDLFA